MATRIASKSASGSRRWRLSSVGHFALVDAASGTVAMLPTRKACAILAFLCAHPGQRFTRERIAALLWGDRGEAQARASLRQALLEIRRATESGPSILQSDRTHLWSEPASLEPEALDQTSWAHSDELLFDDLSNISPDFDEWLAVARAERSRRLADALRKEVEKLLDRGRGAAALPLVDRLHRLDPFDEDGLRLALRAEYQAGRVAGIERRVREMDSRLQDELGVTVSSESRVLRDQLVEALRTSKVEPVDLREPVLDDDAAAGPQPVAPDKASRPWPLLAAAVLVVGALGFTGVRHQQQTAPKMLAVLPFEASKGVDGDLADGLSEELISQLSQNRQLRVIGRTSAWQYKGKAIDLRTIGRQLDVDYLVEGNVARAGDRMRVAVSLVRARDGSAMWSRVYTASTQQTPLIRGTIGSAVVAALGVPERAVAAGYKPKGEAYALYLRARALFLQRSEESLRTARALSQEAIRIDPNFAPPWAYAAGATFFLNERRFPLDPSRPNGPSMTVREGLERALKLDPNFADAHGMLGYMGGNAWTGEGDTHLRRAVELAPNDSQILYWWSFAQVRQGNWPRWAQLVHQAAALDPLFMRSVSDAVFASHLAGDQAAVRRYLERIRAGNPEGAYEVEADLAFETGDLSRGIQIGLRDKGRHFQQSTLNAGMALIKLGFEREGRLVGKFGPNEMGFEGAGPDRATLFKQARETADMQGGNGFLVSAIYQLWTRGRYSDIVALHDARVGLMPELRRATLANRLLRSNLGALVADALRRTGRGAEAARLFQLTEEADDAILAKGPVPPNYLTLLAANKAISGRREEAIELLEQGAARNRGYVEISANGKPEPAFQTLRGDPRFERLVRIADAHMRKERREVIALHLF